MEYYNEGPKCKWNWILGALEECYLVATLCLKRLLKITEVVAFEMSSSIYRDALNG